METSKFQLCIKNDITYGPSFYLTLHVTYSKHCANEIYFDTLQHISRIEHLQDTEGIFFSWWRHQTETFSALLVIRAGLTGLRWIPHTKASDAELWCFLWSVSKKRLRKQSRGWWFQTQLSPLWRNRNVCSLSYVVEHLYGICGM